MESIIVKTVINEEEKVAEKLILTDENFDLFSKTFYNGIFSELPVVLNDYIRENESYCFPETGRVHSYEAVLSNFSFFRMKESSELLMSFYKYMTTKLKDEYYCINDCIPQKGPSEIYTNGKCYIRKDLINNSLYLTIKKENERDTEKYLKIEVVNNIDLYLDKILDGYNPILNVKNLKTIYKDYNSYNSLTLESLVDMVLNANAIRTFYAPIKEMSEIIKNLNFENFDSKIFSDTEVSREYQEAIKEALGEEKYSSMKLYFEVIDSEI